MAPDPAPSTLEVPPHMMEASRGFTRFDLELRQAIVFLEFIAKKADKTTMPCTYQVNRWVYNGFCEAQKLFYAMLKDAEIQLFEQPDEFTVRDSAAAITDFIDNAEIQVDKIMFTPFKLDDLPPGNPGEKEFERLLKPKIALNKSYSALMRAFSVLHTALFSPNYKLGLTEHEYVLAWRAERKKRMQAFLLDIEAKQAENEKYVAGLAAAKKALELQLADNDQMNFDSEIDPTQTPESGD